MLQSRITNPRHRALAGAFASAAGDLLKLAPKNSTIRTPIGRFLTGAIVGGIGSKLVGGNFWQGAAIGAVVTVFNHMNHEEPPTDFNKDYYYDPETGYSYVKISEYLYEIYDKNLQPIGEKYISKVEVGKIFREFRSLGSGLSNAGDALAGARVPLVPTTKTKKSKATALLFLYIYRMSRKH